MGLGIYGIVARRGANIVCLDMRMVWMAVIWGILQLTTAGLGYGAGVLLLRADSHVQTGGDPAHIAACVLLAGCGARMILFGLRKKTILEHRMERINMQEDTLLCLRCCGLSAAAGCAFGLLRYPLAAMVAAAFGSACLCTILGYLGGRIYGTLRTDAAQIAGGALLCGLACLLVF